MANNDLDYAVSNLETLASNISSYASWAGSGIDDPYSELYDRADKAGKAVLSLVRWIKKHERK